MHPTHRAAWTRLRDGDHLWLTQPLRDQPADAVLWECTPTARHALDAPFCAHLTPTRFPPGSDEDPFRDLLAGPGADTRAFDSLGRDARLVAPTAGPAQTGHLLAFLRSAPDAWIGRLWAHVAREVFAWTVRTTDPVWVSTHGHGVLWLHVRLDSRPKYYAHRLYCRTP